ncbi:MAG: DUF4168 domain-containing protein [Spirulina sp.]
MRTSQFLTGTVATLLLMGAPGGAALAQVSAPAPAPQTQLSESQIDRFVSAYQAIQAIQEEIQPDLIMAVESQGLSVEDYNRIAEAQQSPEMAANIPADETEQFAAAVEQVRAIRAEAQAEMETAIQAENLTPEEFGQILTLAQQDPQVQAIISERLAQ